MNRSYKGVRGGTVGGEPLCRSCRNATIVQGRSFQDSFVQCGFVPEPLRFEAFECNKYDDLRVPSLYDMRQIAWQLKTSPEGKWGFVAAKDLTESERHGNYGPAQQG